MYTFNSQSLWWPFAISHLSSKSVNLMNLRSNWPLFIFLMLEFSIAWLLIWDDFDSVMSHFPLTGTVLSASILVGFTTALILFCSHFHQVLPFLNNWCWFCICKLVTLLINDISGGRRLGSWENVTFGKHTELGQAFSDLLMLRMWRCKSMNDASFSLISHSG